MKQIGIIFIIVGVIGLIIGAGVYLLKTGKTEISEPLIIDKWTYYPKNSVWPGTIFYHIDEQVKPNGSTLPNTKYLMVVTFLTYTYQNTISWNQSEINVNAEKTISNVISYEAYTSIIQKPKYSFQFFEIKAQHDVIDLLPGFIILGLGAVIFLKSKKENPGTQLSKIGTTGYYSQDPIVFPEATPEEKVKIAEALKNKKVSDALAKALHHMDTTHTWYIDEDEANRALVTSLKSMGYDEAVYHKHLGDGRTADAFFENSIVEGKLDPQQSEVDRLEGQITEYLKYSYAVHVVLYGHIDAQLLSRIKAIVSRKPERTFLTYLPDAKRIRKRNSS